MQNQRGFTILEVLIAMAILAIAITTLVGAQSRSVVQNDHARQLTTATMLAHDQMFAIETKLRKDGFKQDRETMSGDFRGREYSAFRWKAAIDVIDMEPEYLSSQLTGQLLGTDEDGGSLSGSSAINSQLPTMLGMVTMMIQNVTDNRIRRITLAITWKDLKGEHVFTIRQFMVLMEAPEGEGSLNTGTMPNSGISSGMGRGSSGSSRGSSSSGSRGSSGGGSRGASGGGSRGSGGSR